MKPRVGYFFWILALAFGLMGLIAAAQILSKQNITGLKKGNQDAVDLFAINNQFENLVNLSFELNAKVTTPGALPFKRQTLIDSLTILGYNAAALQALGMKPETKAGFEKLNKLINDEVEAGFNIVNLTNRDIARRTADSLGKLKIADSIYNVALSIQKFLEKDMRSALNSNTTSSSRLSALNKTLALIAIAAILILCAIIINRHIKQVQLIKQLEQATAAARESAMIKEQFLANMSHEIRTPLHAIKGFSRLLSLTPLSSQQKEYTGIINESSSNLLNIVNDILDISKIEAHKLRIENKEFDLPRLLGTTEAMFGTLAMEKGLRYEQQIEADVPVCLKGDPDRLSQILINLVSNAIKFTEKGFIKVNVSLDARERDICRLRFTVSDSGTGIPPGKQDIIFRRFEQLHTADSEVIQGTGLGLSIVKSLTELMNGSVTVQSKEGSGSSFQVVLPFTVARPAVTSETKPSQENSGGDNMFYEGVSILVVEDNKVNQLLMQKTLERKKIKTSLVFNGQEALNMLQTKKFDLIFLDIQMPVMDGYTTARKIRSNNIATPIIAMTAFALPGEKQKCYDAGMDVYLAKPLDYNQLDKVLREYLADRIVFHTDTESYTPVDISELLKLTGGDAPLAKKIMAEIVKEIPPAIVKLEYNGEGKDDVLRKACHHMISTFSPLGDRTETLTKIIDLNAEIGSGNYAMQEIKRDELVHHLGDLKRDLTGMLLSYRELA